MKTRADKTQKNKSRSGANAVSKTDKAFQFSDNSPEAPVQRKLKEIADNSSQVEHLGNFQQMADNFSAQQFPVQKKENKTGLPDNLKSGIETLSGYSMDDVKVHYNSDKPAHLQAHAYTQGTDIHLASGQEKHLPHEAWHVVQQKEGRVRPTMQMKGAEINDEEGLEQEADLIGAKALQTKDNGHVATPAASFQHGENSGSSFPVRQRFSIGKAAVDTGVIQRDRWATADIRRQLGGKAGHHIISKEDLWMLRSWAVTDQTEYSKKFYQKYDTEKKIQNLGYDIVKGPKHYSNNPGDNWDPNTVEAKMGKEDETHLGLNAEEMDQYGISKRKPTEIAGKLKVVQDIYDKRGGQKWKDAVWEKIWNVFAGLEAEESEYDPDKVLDYDADEWLDDTSLQLIDVRTAKEKTTDESAKTPTDHTKDHVPVDGKHVKVDDGKLVIDNLVHEMEGTFTVAANKLKLGGQAVTINKKGKLLLQGRPLTSWQTTKYRKREGYVMEELSPDGEDTIFVKTARTNRTLEEVPENDTKREYAYKSVAKYDENNVNVKFNFGHVLRRHSFQWWAGESTNINIFFPPSMNDEQILEYCKGKIKAYVAVQIPGLTAEAAKNDNAAEHKFDGGVWEDVYLDLAIETYPDKFNEENEDEVEIWGFDVNVKTVAMQAKGVQVPQLALRTIVKSGVEFPIEFED